MVRHRLAGAACAPRSSAAGPAPGSPTATSTPSCALFETAARTEEQRGHTCVANFLGTLAAQQIPADTLAERGVRGDAVRLLTAHRSKGLEWRLVVVAHVQEDGWPDLRRRAHPAAGRPDRRRRRSLPPGSTLARELLAEERRLFYVACTRARERLVVTAVAVARRRRRAALALPRRARRRRASTVQGRPARPLSLRRPGRRAAPYRRRPRRTRARCARPRRAGSPGWPPSAVGRRPLVPQADPATWWGTRAASRADAPVRPADEPVDALGQRAGRPADLPGPVVPRAGGRRAPRASSQAQGFGNVVHALADRVAKGELGRDPARSTS